MIIIEYKKKKKKKKKKCLLLVVRFRCIALKKRDICCMYKLSVKMLCL